MQKESIRLKIALRNAANAIGNLNESTPLRDFFTRINYRKGRVSAIPATARKLALFRVVFRWNMVTAAARLHRVATPMLLFSSIVFII